MSNYRKKTALKAIAPDLGPEIPPVTSAEPSPAAEVVAGPWQCTLNLSAAQVLVVVDGLQAIIKYSIAGQENEQAAVIAGGMLAQLVPVSRQAFAALRPAAEPPAAV